MERKMKFLSNLKKGILFATFTVAALLVLSCEIGLGAAVDTERPKLQITYPPKGAVIMDNFTLAGTVSDDVGLNYLKVTLTNKDLKTTYTYSSKEGQVLWVDPGKNWSKGTTWTASIGKKTEGQTLYNGWDLPDGEYFIDVEANDGYGTTSDRRSVTIDNTPPVFIVENLVSIEGNTNKPSIFGHKINLLGQAKDESGLSKVFFSAFDENGTEIISSKLDYEYTSNGVVLARFSSSEPQAPVEKTLAENFNVIYGTSFDSEEIKDVKDRYLTVQLSDTARKYNSPVFEALGEEAEKTLGTGDGNLATEMYLKTQEFKQEGISIDELKEYRKQLNQNDEMTAKLSGLASTSIAAANYTGSFSNVTKFQINPKLEPTWYINDFEKQDAKPFETLYVGSPLTFHFEWGNNQQQFRPSNIQIVLARLNVNADETYETVLTKEELENITESSDDAIILVKKGEWSEDVTETFTKSVVIDDPLIRTPSSYRIFVFGHDGSGSSGLSFEEKNNNVYGFKAKKNAQVPKIVFLSAKDEKDENGVLLPKDGSGIGRGNEHIKFWFKVLTDGEKLEELPEIEVKLGDKVLLLDKQESSYFMLERHPEVLPEDPQKETDGDKEKFSYTFKWVLNKNPEVPLPTKETSEEWNDEFDFSITVKAKDLGGGESENTITFELDNKEPEITIEPVAIPDMTKTGNKLNGKVEIPVSFSDNNPKVSDDGKNLAAYTVYNETKDSKYNSGTVENEKNIVLETSTFPEEIWLEVSVTDKFGNTGKVLKKYEVDQETDRPVLSFGNLKEGLNSFGIKNNNIIETSVTDDDEDFGKIEVRVRDAAAAEWADEETGWYTIKTGKTTANWNFTKELVESDPASALIPGDGKYKVQFRATDSVDLSTGSVVSAVYEVIADSTKPVFEAESVTDAVADGSEYYVKKDTTAKISVPLTEKNLKSEKNLKFVTVNGQVITPELVSEEDGKYNVKYDWVPGNKDSGIYELEFVAEDESGNSNFKTVTMHYVKELPVISEIEITPEVLSGNKVNGIISYKGSIDQSKNDTKIKKINLALKQKEKILSSTEINNSSSFEWTGINTTLAAFTDKEQLDLVITAEDIAGNKNEKVFSVNVDQETDKPVITFEEDKIDASWTGFEDVENPEKNPGSKKNLLGINDNSSFYIYVNDDDAVGNVTVQAFKADGVTQVAEEKIYTSDKLDAENKVSCDIKNDLGINAAGNYVIKVNASDDKTKTGLNSENNADEKTLYIVVDGVAPDISDVKVDSKDYNGPVYINGEKTISFKVTEMHLTSVWFDGTSIELGTPDISSGSKVYTYSVPYTPDKETSTVVIKADDGTGLSASRELTIKHDKKAPVINDPIVTPTVFGDGKTVNGKITISGTVSDESGYVESEGKVEDDKLEVKLERQDGTSWSDTGVTLTVKNQKYTLTEFDTTTLKDKTDPTKAFKGKIRISVLATDRAGNVSRTEPPYFEYEVDQDTDLPIFKFTNIDADATEGKTNLFGLGKWNITGTVKDDDGAVKLYYKDGEEYKVIKLSEIDNKNEQTFSFEVPHSAGQKGERTVEFLCVENEGAADSTNKKTGKKVLYAIDDQTPNVNSKKLNGNEIGSNDIKLFTRADRKIELVVSDDNGIAKVERYDETSEQWVESDIKKISEEKYEHHITTDNTDGTKTEKYRITDDYGRRSSEIEVSYVVDTTPPDGTPEIKVAAKKYDSTKWLNEGTVDIAITGITDDNLTETVSYKVTGESSGSGNVPIQSGIVSNTVALSDGNSTVTYTYSDKAGNTKDVTVYVNVDTKKPEATVNSVSGVKKPGSLQLSFDATDSQLQNVSGLAYAYIGTTSNFNLTTKGGANGYLKKIELFETTGEGDAAETTYPVSKTGITTEVEIPSTDGKYQYYVVLEDQAGNKSDYTGFGEFTIDGTKPEVKINSVSDADTTTADVVDVNKIIRISGKAEDLHPSGIPGLAIYAVGQDGKKTGSAIEADGLITPVTEPANTFASWAYDVDTTKLSNDKTKYVFEVTASDSVGNSGSNFIVLNVNQTSDRPVISLDSIKTDGTTTLSRGEFEWTLSDDDGAVSSVAVKVTRKGENGTYSNVETAGIDEEGFKTITAENGKYKYLIPPYKDAQNKDTTDGSYKLYFKVTDAKSNSFTSTDATTNAHTEPRIKNGESETGNVLAFDVDGTPPVIGTVQVQVKAEGAVSYGDKVDFKSSVHYGGSKKRYIKLSIPVTDNVITDSKEINVKVKVGDKEAVSLPSTAYNSTASAFEHDINFEKVTSGSVAIIIEAADKSGQSSKKYFNIFVDNLEPNEDGKGVQYMTPSSDTEVTANVSVSANINDDSTANSRVASVKYYVPKNNGIAAETTPSEATPWSNTDLTFSDVVMKLELKGLATAEGNIENIYSGHPQTAPGSGIYYIPVWFRLEDYCGNISYVEKTIRYNPDAVRPRIKLTYPVHNKTVGTGVSAKDYVVLGGSILLAGSAEDNVAVDAVYVQYDINGDGKYSKTVVKIKDGNPVSYTGTVGLGSITVTDSIFTSLEETDTCDKWGIKVEGTTSWNTQFAASGLTGLEIGGIDKDNNQTNPDNKTLNIRMCARDKDYPVPHTSAWTDELHISVNNTVPQFGQFYLIQNAGKDEEKKLPYENGMFIKGDNWRLEGTVVDNDGISKVQIGSTEVTDKFEYNDSVTGYDGFTVRVPVVPVNGNFTVTLTAYDNAEGTPGVTPSQYNINVDNTAPAFKDGGNDDTLVLYAGEYGKTKIDSGNYVQNSNGWTTIASKASEAGSGFARAVFYVERYSGKTTSEGTDTYTNRRFYNVMTGGRINASDVTMNGDKLPVVEKEIFEVEGDHYSFTVVDELNEHIRVGGLVIIGNVYKTITAIDEASKKITVSEKIESAWTYGKQNAQFVYAFVVDHTGESTDSDGNVKYDDGDGIVESLTKSANEYTWDASFDSHNIPDGPLTINVVVFDVAGNSRHGSVVTRITNNPPRITSVKLGTDLNYNGEIQDTDTYSEYTKFYAYKGSHGETDTTRGKEIWNLVPSDETESKDRAWVIKNGLNLIPEFVGGKAPFYYVFSKASGTGSEKYLGTPAAGTNLASATTNTGAQGKFDKDGALKVEYKDIGTDGENSINTYRFTFWDSTEESTVGVNTGWCILNVELKQDLEDSIKPVAHVHPFFWKGKGDGNNSVSWNGNTPNGHIELESDLTTGANGITGTTVNGTALGTDPKVSGTIVIRGTAYDDTKLSKVIVTYDGIIDGSTTKCESEYTASSGTWGGTNKSGEGYSLSVTDLNGGVTQRGHLVEWALTIDTSKVVTGDVKETGLDKKVSVTAVAAYGGDSYGTSTVIDSTSGVTGTATFYATEAQAALGKYYAAEDKALLHKDDYKTSTKDGQTEIFDRVVELVGVKTAATASAPAVNEYKVYGTNSQYQMDIVPYVTEVVTNLSSGKVTNPSVYNRTANGHYPVQSVVTNVDSGKMTNTASEDIVLRGFNLGGTVSVAAASTTNNTALSGDTIKTATGSKKADELCFNASTLKSGRPVITVNSIPLMNNLNNNNARGECTSDTDEKDYDNCYNRTPNYENNNLLTDDIEFDVWEFNDTIVKAANNQFISGFAMQINQKNKIFLDL